MYVLVFMKVDVSSNDFKRENWLIFEQHVSIEMKCSSLQTLALTVLFLKLKPSFQVQESIPAKM